MEYTRLGRSGLTVSRAVLGCMGLGEPGGATWQAWTIGLEDARPTGRQALEAGITTFDTANVYSHGSSEEIIGTLLAESARRDEVVIATRSGETDGPRAERRRAVTRRDPRAGRREPATPEDRLHRPLSDPPLRPGDTHRGDARRTARPRARRQGALRRRLVDVRPGSSCRRSTSPTWAWMDPLRLDAGPGTTCWMREEEREMLPFCLDQGVGVLPWSSARPRLPDT